jgi:hypothetical protein
MRADGFLRLEDHHLAAGERQRARHGEPDHAGADDYCVKLFHARMRF